MELSASLGGVMSILERIRATDRMLEVVDELSRHMGMSRRLVVTRSVDEFVRCGGAREVRL